MSGTHKIRWRGGGGIVYLHPHPWDHRLTWKREKFKKNLDCLTDILPLPPPQLNCYIISQSIPARSLNFMLNLSLVVQKKIYHFIAIHLISHQKIYLFIWYHIRVYYTLDSHHWTLGWAMNLLRHEQLLQKPVISINVEKFQLNSLNASLIRAPLFVAKKIIIKRAFVYISMSSQIK